MSVTIRPYVDGGWEKDIQVVLPDGAVIRERRKFCRPENFRLSQDRSVR